MTDVNVLTSLAGGGVGAVVLGCAFILYKCLQNRSCHSKSGCINVDLSSPHSEHRENFEPTRTPVPSIDVKT